MLTLSCTSRERPEDLIEKEAMIELMVDVQIAEALYSGTYQTEEGNVLSYADVFNPVYEKHGVSRKQFEKSLEWYSKDLDEITAMYDDVIERLNRMEGELMVDDDQEPIGPDE
jgi:hypothetical protein